MKIKTPIEDDEDTVQDENCLTLNIWTRGEGKNKPVMIWIYGGAFLNGYSSENLYSGPNFVSAQAPVKALKDGGVRGIKFLTGINACEWGYWLLYDENYF